MLIIRENQMKVFADAMRRSFEDRMVKHLRDVFPETVESLGAHASDDGPIREWIRQGITAAAS